ncbi:MAG: transposase, partial [Alkaliphilus sp.]
MARPLRIEYEGALYHITTRGNERKKIYYAEADYEKFKSYLKDAQNKYGYLLHCYALMTNHYHLLIETPYANISKVMHYINGSYTSYLNKKRERSGHLFQGRYKAILVDQDSYLLELSRYIHLNPVR